MLQKVIRLFVWYLVPMPICDLVIAYYKRKHAKQGKEQYDLFTSLLAMYDTCVVLTWWQVVTIVGN